MRRIAILALALSAPLAFALTHPEHGASASPFGDEIQRVLVNRSDLRPGGAGIPTSTLGWRAGRRRGDEPEAGRIRRCTGPAAAPRFS